MLSTRLDSWVQKNFFEKSKKHSYLKDANLATETCFPVLPERKHFAIVSDMYRNIIVCLEKMIV